MYRVCTGHAKPAPCPALLSSLETPGAPVFLRMGDNRSRVFFRAHWVTGPHQADGWHSASLTGRTGSEKVTEALGTDLKLSLPPRPK